MPSLWKTNSWANWPDNFTVLSFSPTWRRKRTPCAKDFFKNVYWLTVFSKLDARNHVSKENSPTWQRYYEMFRLSDDDPKSVHPGDHCHTQPHIHRINHLVISVQISSSLQKSSASLGNRRSLDPHSPQAQNWAWRKGAPASASRLPPSWRTALKCSANPILPIKNCGSSNLKLGWP